jgi:putative Mg2+ transporter-C (MgtC) family protein
MIINLEFGLRLLVAGILGAAIGLEREYRAKEAGYRTHFLVSLGSALLMIVSQYSCQDLLSTHGISMDPSRIASQVVTGIGFIGAGTIILQKHIVRGLTTAAGIWTTAGIGLAVGAGMYTLGIAATILTLIGLELLGRVFKSVGMKSSIISLSSTNKDIFKEIATLFKSKDYLIVSYQMEKERYGEHGLIYQVTMVIKSKRNNDEGNLLSIIQEIPEVTVERIE